VDAAAAGDDAYGGQLGSDSIGSYADMVKEAVEDGTERGKEFLHTFDDLVGADVKAGGKATKKYRVRDFPDRCHVIPDDSI
jgi:hypothetical protein